MKKINQLWKESDFGLKFKYVVSVLFLTVIMFAGGITYKDLFQGVIEKIPDLTEDSAVRTTINIAKYVKKNVSTFAKSKNDLYYKDVRAKKFIDKYGYSYNLTTSIYGTKNPDCVLHDNGELSYVRLEDDISEPIQNFLAFANDMKQDNRNFLLFMPPYKFGNITDDYKGVFHDHSAENTKLIADTMRENDIDVISTAEIIESEGMDKNAIFFRTDHHWLPQTGLWACHYLGDWLNENCGYSVDTSIFDEENYMISYADDLWLGSLGKKATEIYYPDTEPFPIIAPKYDSDLDVYYQHSDETLHGTITETLLDESCLYPQDTLAGNMYAYYGYGDKPLIQIHNHLKKDGKRMLIIKESFADCMCPFLSNAAEYVDVIDVRHYTENLHDYIDETDPDTVVVIYSVNGFTSGMDSEHFE